MIDHEIVSEESQFLQGDIFKKVMPTSDNCYMILISADCDIANHKLPKTGFACLELIPLRQYLLFDHAHSVATRQIKKRTEKLAAWLNEKWISKNKDNLKISVESVVKMLELDSIEDIEEKFGVTPSQKKSHIRTEIECIKKAKTFNSEQTEFAALDALVALQTNGRRTEQLKSLSNSLQPDNLPIDVFFISDLPQEPNIGYIAKLRSLSFIPVDKCFSSFAKARENDEAFLRICRLTSTFRHGLAQQLGMLFSRIGYPADYELNREKTFNFINDDISNQLEKLND